MAAITLGRGQILGLSGLNWRRTYARMQDAARHEKTIFSEASVNAATAPQIAGAMRGRGAALFFITLEGAPEPALLEELLDAAQALGQSGGGVVIGADALQPDSRFTRTLILPSPQDGTEAAPRLMDDGGAAVSYLRQGEWGAFRFPLNPGALDQAAALQLAVTGGGLQWISDPVALDSWRSLLRDPADCIAEMAVCWPPGSYQASLTIIGRAGGHSSPASPVPLTVRPGTAAPASADRHVNWRFTGLRRVERRAAALMLKLSPRNALTLQECDQDYLLSGWYGPERSEQGRLYRWSRQSAVCALGGPGNILQLELCDLRPRTGKQDKTLFSARIDHAAPQRWTWETTGLRELNIPWPDDALLHRLTLEVDPVWLPAEHGSAQDQRRLGLQIFGMKVTHGGK